VPEIACDESGYEGEKLIDTTTDVFAHASLRVGESTAAGCLTELRRLVRSPASQYKSGHLLREKSRPALEWFLGPDSPVYAHGHVHVIDKAYFVTLRLAELFQVDGDDLFASGPPALGPDRWAGFLGAANDLLRGKDQPGVVDAFLRAGDGLLPDGRERAELFRGWLREDPVTNSVLDPLVPSIVAAVDHWVPEPGESVTVAHDRQTQLPAARITRLTELCRGRLAGVHFLDAESHPRIQLADMLAGTIRKIVSDHRGGTGDPALTALAAPYLGRSSVWPPAGPPLPVG
jgi:hypothetical protein